MKRKKNTKDIVVPLLYIQDYQQKLDSFKKFSLYKTRIENEYNKQEAKRIDYSESY
jgi:hypothetical protein